MLTLDFSDFPVLTTPRLQLRQMLASDADALFELRSDDRVMQYFDRPKAASIDEVQILIEKITTDLKNNEGITWAIALRNDPKLVGTIGFWRIEKEHHRAEIGYSLHPDFWRAGIMSEAMDAVLNFGFLNMQLHSIEAAVNPGNTASIGLLMKHQFVQEAYFRENYYFNGAFLDTKIFSLLNPHHSTSKK